MTYTLIAHTELTSGQSSITFSSIPQTFTDLQLVISARNNEGGFYGYFEVRLNGASSGHTQRILRGNGSGVVSSTNTVIDMAANATGTTANTFNNGQVYIPNYASSVAKSMSVDWVMEQNATEAYQEIKAGLYNSTSPVTSIVLFGFSNFLQFTSATLYGITAGSSGGVVVS